MGGTRLGPLREREGGGGVRPVGPDVLQIGVPLCEGRLGKTEHIEQLTRLLRCSLIGRHCEQLALGRGERINFKRSGLRGCAESEPAKGVTIEFAVFIEFATMAIPAAVLLVDYEFQGRAACETLDRLVAFKHRALFLVSPHRDQRRGPSALLSITVDRVSNAEAGGFEASNGSAELDLVRHRWLVGRIDLACELLEQEAPFGD